MFVLRLYCPRENSNTIVDAFRQCSIGHHEIADQKTLNKLANGKCVVYPGEVSRRVLNIGPNETLCVFLHYDDILLLATHTTLDQRLYPTFGVVEKKKLRGIHLVVSTSIEDCRAHIEAHLKIKSNLIKDTAP